MQPTRTLPENYHVIGSLDLAHDQRALLWLNILGLLLFIVFGWLFFRAALWLRPHETLATFSFQLGGMGQFFTWLGALLLLLVGMLALHEAVHGVCFALFTHARPTFGFRGAYAFAAAPDWYLPRGPYLVTGMAPLVLLSLAGLLLLTVVPAGWIFPLLVFLVLNSSGAVGDLVICAWLLRQPSTCYVQDKGDSVTLYLPN